MAIIQVAGLASAWLARVGEGSARQAHYQGAFLVLLALMGLTTVAAAVWGPGPCLMSGTTLAVMVLAATWDFSVHGEGGWPT